jgi:type II secretory pathway pseudopilin PulG
MSGHSRKIQQQRGFTIMQMVVTIAIIAVVSTFGVLGIKNARAEFVVQNSARVFATYIEKARADSIRRHAVGAEESSVESFGAGTNYYAVTMDYGSGTVETRNFQFEGGVTFDTDGLKVTFDWRGRLKQPCPFTKACVFQVKSNYLGLNIPVDVSGSGDVTVGEQHFPDGLIAEIPLTDVPDDVDHTDAAPTPTPTPDPNATPAIEASPSPDSVDSTPTPTATPTPTPTATPSPSPTNGNGNGNGNGSDGNNGNGNGNGNASPTPTPSPTSTASPSPSPIAQCASSISPSSLDLSQSDTSKQTGSATFTMTSASGVRIISASQAGNGNSLVIGLSLLRIDGNGSSVISVTTKHGAGNRGTFVVEVSASPACGSTQKLTVNVGN